MKQLEWGDRDIVDLGVDVAELTRKAYPQQKDTANRQATEAFVHALDKKLALEVRCNCHRSEDQMGTEGLLLPQHG